MSVKTSLLLIPVTLFSLLAVSSERDSELSLRFEDSPFKNTAVYCEEEKSVVARSNDFEIVNYALMSSERGHRHALLTIKNTSSGQRTLIGEHLVAILANCDRIYPIDFEVIFKGNELITKEVDFGINRFPIIQITNKPKS